MRTDATTTTFVAMENVVYYLPLLTFILSLYFAYDLYCYMQTKQRKSHLRWWMIGMLTYGAGTLCESINTLFGWSDLNFRLWYITGALLGGAPLAQGTVYLLLKKNIAHVLTAAFLVVLTVASVCVFLTPIRYDLVEPMRMSGKVFEWQWVRSFSPFLNIYAVFFLVGGAIYSATLYFIKQGVAARCIGNVLIAVGAILPAIGGTSTRFGHVEILYITELIGLVLIFIAYRVMRSDTTTVSVHTAV